MYPDQLTRNERIRLEALAQANAYSQMKHFTPQEVLDAARIFEVFIRQADQDWRVS